MSALIGLVYIRAVPESSGNDASATISVAELAATVSALQVQLVGVQSRMRESEAQSESLRETIVNLTQENQLLKRRLHGNKTERTQTSELQLSLGNLLDAGKQLSPRERCPVETGARSLSRGTTSFAFSAVTCTSRMGILRKGPR